MTREEQRKLRELNKALPQILKNKIKKYKFKKKDYMIWYLKNDLFYSMHIFVNANLENKCICSTSESIKPLWLDELLWKLLRMESNLEEPMSLRAIGAFTVSGSRLYEDETELEDWSIENMEKCVDKYLLHFFNSIQNTNIDDYYSKIDPSGYHGELRVALSHVHNGEYEKAIEHLTDQGKGRFCNGLIWSNEAIRNYCKKQLRKGNSIFSFFHNNSREN